MKKRLLFIDDELMILDAMSIIFEDLGFEVLAVSDPAEGIAAALGQRFDLIITDLRMPGKNGAEITAEIRASLPDARILLITAYPNDPLVQQALSAGAVGLVAKPFEVATVLDYLRDGQG